LRLGRFIRFDVVVELRHSLFNHADGMLV
jgi:hypothetical protein